MFIQKIIATAGKGDNLRAKLEIKPVDGTFKQDDAAMVARFRATYELPDLEFRLRCVGDFLSVEANAFEQHTAYLRDIYLAERPRKD